MDEAQGKEGAAQPLDPELAGVSLSAYAAVLTYTGEGIPIEQSLDHAAISGEEWPVVEAAWSERLADSAAEDGALIAACDEHRFAAEAHVERRLPELDVELRAWLDFFRAFTQAEDPLGFLGTRGMIERDVFRLLRFWQARMAADGALQEAAAAILASPAGPTPAVKPEPPKLLAATRWPRRAREASAPPKRPAISLEETSVAVPDLSRKILPFLDPGGVPVVLPPSPVPATRKPSGLEETSAVVLTVPLKPALPFASKEGAGAAPPRMAEPAPPASPPSPEPERAAPSPERAAPPLHPFEETSLDVFALAKAARSSRPAAAPLDETSPVVLGSAKPALPFVGVAGGDSPARAALAPRLSVQAYAAIQAEIARSPATAMATIALYGLTPEAKQAEDAAWLVKFAAEPGVQMAWIRELLEAGARRRGER